MAGANDPRFAEVERQYYALKAQLAGGQLSREQFEAALQKLMILDARSRYWMMGAETGKWYMYDGQNWQLAEPPTSAAPAKPPTAASTAATQSDSTTLSAFTPPAAAASAGAVTPDAAPTMTFTPPAATATADPATPDAAPTTTFTPPAAEAPAPATPDAAPTMTFTPPAAEAPAPATPDAAPTMTFKPPTAEAPAPATPDAAPTMTFTPPAKSGGVTAQPDSALTMPAFTPPATNMPPLDRATTVAAFAPPKVAMAGTMAPTRSVPAAPGGRKISPALMIGCLFALAFIVGVVALGLAVNARFGGAPAPVISAASASATTTAATAAATATGTPAPANTVAPAATASPTPLPPPTRNPSPQPQSTPPVVSAPTATPTATKVPATATPTATTEPATATATDTAVPPPTRPPQPVVEFPVSFSYEGYERWGRPSSDCTAFNNKDAVRQFKWDESVTNKTSTAITGADWGMPAATNNEGTQVAICALNTPNIPPGQTAMATFAAYVNLNQFVQRIVHQIRNTKYVRCLDASPNEVPC